MSVWVEICLTYTHTLDRCSHAPRERVSWNTNILVSFINHSSHAPRERVSWNLNISRAAIQLSRHAPRERVSWNDTPIQYTCFRRVTLHVSVWVEIKVKYDVFIVWESRSTWACELKWLLSQLHLLMLLSRSTWACELKYRISLYKQVWTPSRSTWACELKW